MKRVLTLVLAMALVCALCLSFGLIASADGTPEVSIYSKNVSYADSLHIVYAVKADNISDTDTVEMLFWGNDETDFADEGATVVTAYYLQNVLGADCYIFESAGIAAREMTDCIYARARVTSGDNKYYSAIDRYSVLEYAAARLADNTATADQIALYNALLNYGAAAQKVLNYKTNTLANDASIRCNITVDGGKFAWGATSALFIKGEEVTVTADEVDGSVFLGWANAAGSVLSTDATYTFVADGDLALTATYGCDHDIVSHPAKAPSCTEIGWEAYETCSKCDYTTYVELPMIAHTCSKDLAPITDANGLIDGIAVTFSSVKSGSPVYAGALGTNTYLASAEANEFSMTLVVVDGGYAFKLADGKYLGATAVKVLAAMDEPYVWSISFKDGKITIKDSYGTMKYNSSSPRFTTYASGQADITLLGYCYIEGTPATCQAAGTVEHYICSACGAKVDAEGKVLDSVVLPALAHTEKPVSEIPAECGKAGTTAGVVCEVCGTVLSGCEEIPALVHEYENGNCIHCGAADPDAVINDADHPFTVEQALAIAGGLGAKEYTEKKVYVKGLVLDGITKSVYNNAQQRTFYIVDNAGDENKLYISKLNLDDASALDVAVGDVVVVYGYLQNYNGTLEMTYSGSENPALVSVTPGTVAVTSEGDNATVTVAESAVNGSTLTFTVAPADGYEIVSVKAYGEILAAYNGTYSVTVAGPVKIVVATKEAGAVAKLDATLKFPDDNSASNKIGAYDKTWTAKIGDQTYTIFGFNNNNWSSWTYIKCGSSKAASVASISTVFAQDTKKITLNISKCTSAAINSVSVTVINALGEEVETVTKTSIKAGDLVFDLTKANAGCTIKIEFNCQKASSNGPLQLTSVHYEG